jgi:hypothetical protein
MITAITNSNVVTSSLWKMTFQFGAISVCDIDITSGTGSADGNGAPGVGEGLMATLRRDAVS